MSKLRTALFALAIGAGLPAMASAQRDGMRPDDGGPRPERDGGRRPDGGGPRNFGGDRGGPPPAPPQAPAPQQAQPAPQPGALPNFADRRDRGDWRGRDGGQPGRPGQPGPGFDPDRRGYAGGGWRGGDQGRPAQPGPGFDPNRRGFAGGGDPRWNDRGPGGPDRPGFDPRRDPRQGFAPGGYGRDDRRYGYDRGRGGFGPGPDRRIGSDWRQDRRYDWQGWRSGHREVFHIGRYVPPRGYGYGYRRFTVGYRLSPFYFASNYWIDDPYDYRLPPVWGSYRWVRYYDDVLLVDLHSGEVVDVIYDFFW